MDLWDKKGDYLISSRHGHLSIGMGECVIGNDETNSNISISLDEKRQPINRKNRVIAKRYGYGDEICN